MKWHAAINSQGNPQAHAIESECGRFTICRVLIWGTARYELWRREAGTAKRLRAFDSADAAKSYVDVWFERD
ncbi:MAG: hypothetical protein OES09_05540 [Gammaproteobacteria bacterium]|nr:hypothetical protein [Gammaproteobacteria bacterium]